MKKLKYLLLVFIIALGLASCDSEDKTPVEPEPVEHVHTYGETTYEWSSDNTKVTAKRVCTQDSTHVETETVDTTSKVTQGQSCEDDELTTYIATFTNSAFEVQTKENIVTKEKLGHNYGEVVYTWSSDYSTVTATRKCSNDSTHVETETVDTTSKVTQGQSCEDDELTTYTATFTNSAFKVQTKENIVTKEKLDHNYGEVVYTWSSDYSTVTATRKCSNDSTHIETETVDTTSKVTQGQSCEDDELTTYTATFTNSAFKVQTKENIVTKEAGHIYSEKDGFCIYGCGDKISIGLDIRKHMNNEGYYYVVEGIGTCVEQDIIIPKIFNGFIVKEIKKEAFKNCNTIVSITIPDSITKIGDSTFYNCTSLASITIPNSVTSIGNSAFYNCTSLANITIPNSVISIDKAAFYGCNSLTSITIPFVGERLNDAYYNNFGYIFGARIYSENSTYVPSSLENVIVTGGNIIANYAFSGCNNIKNIIIPDSVTSIGELAFEGCNNLINLTIGKSITSIGKSAFQDSYLLENVYYTGTIESWCNIIFGNVNSTLIYAKHFNMIDENNKFQEVSEIVIPDSITKIRDFTFVNFSSLKNVTLGNSVTSIGDSAFRNCTSLANITIGNKVASIGRNAFMNCSNLKNVYYNGTIESWCNIEFNDYSNSNPMSNSNDSHFYMLDENNEYSLISEIVIPNTIESINVNQFYGFNDITSITIPDSVTNIGDSAFNGCTSLINLTIGNNVTNIGAYAFNNCTSLINLTIGKSVTKIGTYAFSGSFKIENLYYTGTIEAWCNIEFVNSSANPMSNAKNFYMLDKNNDYCKVTQIELPNTISSVNKYTFYCSQFIESIIISSSVKIINDFAFHLCDNLKNVYYEGSVDDWSDITIGYSNFNSSTIYYYSDVEPTDTTHNYWHYGSNGNIVIW